MENSPPQHISAEIEDVACEGSLPAIHSTHGMAQAEPRPQAQDSISVGPGTDLVRYGKESSAVGLSHQVSPELPPRGRLRIRRQPPAEAQLPQEWQLRLQGTNIF